MVLAKVRKNLLSPFGLISLYLPFNKWIDINFKQFDYQLHVRPFLKSIWLIYMQD